MKLKLINWVKNNTIRKYWWLKLLWNKSFLDSSGWKKSYKLKRAVLPNLAPIPWLSYPCYKILDQRLKDDFKVFEYGLGSSTLYFDSKQLSCYGVEHDSIWYNSIKKAVKNPENFIYKNLGSEYHSAIEHFTGLFDLIIVDGRDRLECLKPSLKKLNIDGVIILDDSHRKAYEDAFTLMSKHGFKYLNLWGFGNGSIELKSTTIFYKINNCLNL